MRHSVWGVLWAMLIFGRCALAQNDPLSLEELKAQIDQLQRQLARLQAQLVQLQRRQGSVPSAAKKSTPIRVSGYIQMRYVRDDSRPTDTSDLARGKARESFQLRRARFNLRAHPFKGGLFRLQIDASGSDVTLKDAYFELPLGDGLLRLGHFKVPLLEEVLESSSVRWTPERARVSRALFPGERDRGFVYIWSKPGMPQIFVGLFSGTRSKGGQESLTSRKSWLIRLVQPLGKRGRWGQLWVGRMDGIGRKDFGDPLGIVNFDRERTVFGLLLTPIEGLTIRGEWVDGKDAGTEIKPTVKVRGWYVVLGYTLPMTPLTLYGKYDRYDPDRSIRGDIFERIALGVQYDFNKLTRLNLTWEKSIRPDAMIWTFQTQLRY